MKWDDPVVVAALVSAATSVFVLVITGIVKVIYDRHFHIFKLEYEHRYEQRKNIKGILSKNKVRLLKACESLNHRLWNLRENCGEDWLQMRGDYAKPGAYFDAFVYRVLAVFAWIGKIEDEMVFLDTTVCTRQDMEFIKYMQVMPHLMCDVHLFRGREYNRRFATDHFFRSDFDRMVDALRTEDGVMSFAQFRDRWPELLDRIRPMCRFLDGLTPSEDRLRWDRLHILHLYIMAFLNSFGYDYQFTENHKLAEIGAGPKKVRLMPNFVEILRRNRLHKQREIKRLLKAVPG